MKLDQFIIAASSAVSLTLAVTIHFHFTILTSALFAFGVSGLTGMLTGVAMKRAKKSDGEIEKTFENRKSLSEELGFTELTGEPETQPARETACNHLDSEPALTCTHVLAGAVFARNQLNGPEAMRCALCMKRHHTVGEFRIICQPCLINRLATQATDEYRLSF